MYSQEDKVEIVILTKENIPEVAKKIGRSEDDLAMDLATATRKDQVCYVFIQLWLVQKPLDQKIVDAVSNWDKEE